MNVSAPVDPPKPGEGRTCRRAGSSTIPIFASRRTSRRDLIRDLLVVDVSGGAPHRLLDAHVGPATADVAVHRRHDLIVRGIRRAREQRRAAHDLSGLAVAALRHVDLFPGALCGVIAVGRQPFDGGDPPAAHLAGRHRAGPGRDAVEMNGAGAAEAAAAAELGADQIEVIAQHPEQRRLRINVELDGAVVDGERNHGHAGVYAAARQFGADPSPMFRRGLLSWGQAAIFNDSLSRGRLLLGPTVVTNPNARAWPQLSESLIFAACPGLSESIHSRQWSQFQVGRVERASDAQSVVARRGRGARRAEGDAGARGARRNPGRGGDARSAGGARVARRLRVGRRAASRDSRAAPHLRRRHQQSHLRRDDPQARLSIDRAGPHG